jgi:hypothetical protein
MPKLVTLIVSPKYPHRKQIKIDYEAHLVLNNKIFKKHSIKNKIKNNPCLFGVNPLSTILES